MSDLNLKQYQSHKIVHAESMTYSMYESFRVSNKELRSSIVEVDKNNLSGYHIIYDLGSDGEYHSWCPKGKFEKGYVEVVSKTANVGLIEIDYGDIRGSFGKVARDKITGFTGTITAKCAYITGCDQYCLTTKVKDEYSKAESLWFDINRVDVLEDDKVVEIDTSDDVGCMDSPAAY